MIFDSKKAQIISKLEEKSFLHNQILYIIVIINKTIGFISIILSIYAKVLELLIIDMQGHFFQSNSFLI